MADTGDPMREDGISGPSGALANQTPEQIARQSEPVATEPLERVGTEAELNAETVVDKQYVNEKEATEFDEMEEYEPMKKDHSSSASSAEAAKKAPLHRTQSAATTATSASELSRIESNRGPMPTSHRWYRYLSFKRRTVPPIPRERAVSREYTANLWSKLTFQWMAPLMSVGYQRPLEHNDIWLVNPTRTADVLTSKTEESFKRRVASGDKRPLLGALHETLKFEFWLGGACQLTSSVLQVVNPFVLRYLITFATEAYDANRYHTPAPSVGKGVGLVIGITAIQIVQNMATNQMMYRGMMNGGQARAILISMVFDKSLKISGRARAGGKSAESAKMEEKPADLQPGSEEERKWFQKILPGQKKAKPQKPNGGDSEQKDILGDGSGYGNGRILTLMSVDTYRVDQASGMFHLTWTAPIAMIITLILLLVNLKASALAGYGLLVFAMPALGSAIRSLINRRKGINKLTDQRVSLTQEVLSAVRFVKYFGWETSFLGRIGNIRSQEIRSIQFLLAIRNGINAISMSMPIFAAMLAFIAYSYTHPGLNPALIFSSLALFNSLRIPLNMLPLVIGQVTDAVSSISRIQQFLMAEDEEDQVVWDQNSKKAIVMENGSFTWERSPNKDGAKDAVDASKNAKEIRVAAKEAKKEARRSKRMSKGVNGEKVPPSPTTPDEKDSIPFSINDLNFSASRNELIAVIGGVGSGKTSLLAALAGDMRKTSGLVTMGANRAFCPQSAWIQNATVRANILFGKDMHRRWYNEVIDACALRPDLEMLPSGDLTEIGEKGITVSGGQKQRLNIARAIYFDSDIVLMDDPLSAVDAHVGRHIMDQAICGLLRDKCRILATHQLWVLNRCDRIIWMDQGRIIAMGTFDELMASSEEFVKLIASNAQEEKEESVDDEDEVEDEKKQQQKKKKGKKPRGALMQEEERAVASVSWGVYVAYIKASGSILVLPLVFLLLVLAQGATITTSLWLSWWTSDKFHLSNGTYVGVYAALGCVQAILMFLFSVALSIFGTQASKVMLHQSITRVLRAPMSFFDTTPLGRITNRFSKDIDTMDNTLTDNMRFFFITMGMIVSVFILIIAYFYYFAVALAPLFVLFLFSASFYRSSAREVKRHEAVLRSHVFARFSEAVTGIATIRAYGLQGQFRKTIREAVDDMDSAYFLTFANQRWLSVRLDAIGNLLVFTVGILVVTSRFSVSPSTGGLVLSYILSIVQMIQFTIRQLAEVENNMNSTERIHHYGTYLEEEPPLSLPNPEVTESWPQRGEIHFNNVEMRYRAGLPLVLKGLNLKIAGGERIGVVGRTGAGKSSIMSTLFRLVELSGGNITIDGVDIAKVGLTDLRSRLSIIPQDPTLFRGTIRSNLDPFGRYNDHELWNALRSADLVGETTSETDTDVKSGRIHLDTTVDEEGLNFSLGQRQLMALARALVRGSQIIVCDEATSSVDMETDERIQRTIQTGFKGKTLLCIAHRLKTIISYDRIVVMDNGAIAECDTPIALYDKGGIFRGMCERSSIRREDFMQA